MKETVKTCAHCGKEFTTTNPRKKYCSDSHRISAFYKRKGYKVIPVAPDPNSNAKEALQIADQSNLPGEIKEQEKSDFNIASIGAAAAGSLLGDGIKSFFTNDMKKPASKEFIIQVFKAYVNESRRIEKRLLDRINKLEQKSIENSNKNTYY